MFKMTISTDNAAFDGSDCYAETARILRDVATAVERGTREGVLHDINGNKIGRFDLDKPQGREGRA